MRYLLSWAANWMYTEQYSHPKARSLPHFFWLIGCPDDSDRYRCAGVGLGGVGVGVGGLEPLYVVLFLLLRLGWVVLAWIEFKDDSAENPAAVVRESWTNVLQQQSGCLESSTLLESGWSYGGYLLSPAERISQMRSWQRTSFNYCIPQSAVSGLKYGLRFTAAAQPSEPELKMKY